MDENTKMNNKKGALILVPFMVFLFVVGLVIAWSMITSSQQSFNEKIGERQSKLINTYQQAEKALLYIDQSAKYSAYQSIYDLAQNGGFSKEKKCGDYLNYSFWRTDSKEIDECTPDFKENFKLTFNDNLNQHFEKYNKNSNIIIPKDNYNNLVVKGKLTILGIADSDLTLPIGLKREAVPTVVSIEFTPSNTDIDTYLKITKSPLAGLGQCMIDAEKRTKVPASVILSVALHETGYGKSGLAQKSKNLFGIKCTKSYIEKTCTFADKKECCKVWDKTALDLKYEPNSPNAYRVYQNHCESINNFAGLISQSKRYSIAMQFASQPTFMIYKIREAGYATDPNWATGVNNIMQKAQAEIKKIKENAIG